MGFRIPRYPVSFFWPRLNKDQPQSKFETNRNQLTIKLLRRYILTEEEEEFIQNRTRAGCEEELQEGVQLLLPVRATLQDDGLALEGLGHHLSLRLR